MKRRDFVKSLGLVAGGLVLPAVSVPAVSAPTVTTPVTKSILDVDWSLRMDKYLDTPLPVPEGKFDEVHMHASFVIMDREMSRSLEDLMASYCDPVLMALARKYNDGEVFLFDHTLSAISGSGRVQINSYGGRVPIRCTLEYHVPTSGVMVTLDTIGLELHRPKTSIPSQAPTVVGDYPAGYTGQITTTSSDWEIGDTVEFLDRHFYVIIGHPKDHTFYLDHELRHPVDHGTPAVYAGTVKGFQRWS